MSSEVQIAVIDQQDTQIVLAVPGVQGATGSEIAAGGTANQVLRKASSTDYDTDWSLVTSAMIENGAIVDADVNASAAIAGTKISPNFGSQAVVTTGTSTAASFIPTSNTAPTNGLYLPDANNVAISTNGTGALFIDANGKVGIGTTPEEILHIKGPSEPENSRDGVLLQHSTAAATADTGLPIVWTGYGSPSLTNYGFASICGRKENGSSGDFAGYLQFATGDASGSVTEKARITADGKLGLGTNSPSGKLDIVTGTTGNVLIDAEAGSNFHAKVVNDSGDLHVGTRSTSADTFLVSNRRIYLRTGASESNALFVNESGNVGLGTSNPGELFHLQAGSLANTDINSVVNLIRITDLNSRYNATNTSSGNFLSGIRWDAVQSNGSNRFGSAIYQQVSRNYFGTSPTFMRTSLVFATRGDNEASSTDPVERLRIDHQGRVGIGTTQVSAGLHVVTDVNPVLKLDRGTANNANANLYYNGTLTGQLTAANADFQISAAGASTPMSFYVNGSPRAAIDTSGRLLVGTPSALTGANSQYSKFIVQGTTTGSAFGASVALSRGTAASGLSADAAVGGLYFSDILSNEFASIESRVDGTTGATAAPGRLVFSTTADGASSPTEHARITQGGYLKVSSNGTYDSTTGIYNEYYQAGNNFALLLRAVGASTYTSSALAIGCDRNTSNSTYNFILCGVTGVGDRFIVRDSGDVVNTNNSYGQLTSDERFKQDIVDAPSQWDDIKAVRLTKYRWKSDPTGDLLLGPIAQELQAVSPGLVDTRIATAEDVPASGGLVAEGDEVLGFKASILYMKAVGALQEAMERIEQLEAKVAALESQ